MGRYDYLLDDAGKLKTINDYHDVYVELKVNKRAFLVPVSLPRRMPELQFDLQNPTDDLWMYLDECAKKLSPKSIANWKKEQIKTLSGKKGVTHKLLLELINNGAVCSACFFSGDNYNPNPQKNIQNLRDRGYIIVTHRGMSCLSCKQKKARYTITPVLMNRTYSAETIPEELKTKICEVFDFRDAYTGIRNPNVAAHIPDHKFPEDRWDSNTAVSNNVNMSREEILKKFQLLNAQTNMQKKQSCSECIRSGKRGYPFGIKYYYAGGEDWDLAYPKQGIDAEQGCVGCGWYDLLKWKEELNKKINGED